MASGARCEGCRGKFPLLEPGGVECAVCGAFHRVRNLVWGARFPHQLGGIATRRLQDCYLQLLQEADQYYFQQVPTEVALRPGEAKGSEPHTPRASPAKKERTDRRSRDRRTNKDRNRDREREDRDRGRRRRGSERQEPEPPLKERKTHRREEDEGRRRGEAKVKEEGAGETAAPLVPVKEEEESEVDEGEESETATEDKASPSKSPLPRRRPAISPVRPRSPEGPPPGPVRGESEGPPGRWEGQIPGRYRPAPDAGGSDARLPGIAPKAKPKKKKKNKGKKHKARQERRRAERGRR